MKFLKITSKQKLAIQAAAGLGLAAINAWIDWSRDHRLFGTYVLIGIICVFAVFYYDYKRPKK